MRRLGNPHRGAEADEIVHHGPPPRGPHGLRGLEMDRQGFDNCIVHFGLQYCKPSCHLFFNILTQVLVLIGMFRPFPENVAQCG